jgi:hypothetical protein
MLACAATFLLLHCSGTGRVDSGSSDVCDPNPCENAGMCVEGIGQYTCNCALGYAGARCEIAVGYCTSSACENGGTCIDGQDSYTCQCSTGFSGTRCETNIDDCVSNLCANGATCVDGIGEYTCQCPIGYAGALCDVPTSQTGPQVIAVWAFPDGVSVPYRDSNNNLLASNIHIGVVAYHSTGINGVVFSVDGTSVGATVNAETINPETNEYEYVFELAPDQLGADGPYTVKAIAYANAGSPRTLPTLIVQKDTAPHSVLHVGDGGYSSLDAACKAATGGDIIKIRSGTYVIPGNTGYNFTKYVTVMPEEDNAVTIIPNGTDGTIRSSYMKFKGVTFDISASVQTSIFSGTASHLWMDACTTIGNGKDNPNNNSAAFRFYQTSEYDVVENCVMRDTSFGAVFAPAALSAGNYIFRHNTVYDVTSDGISFDGQNILISNNLIHNNVLPTGGDQHCDFLQSNSGVDNAVLRNNTAYDGDHQGVKFGGYNDGRDQPYSNIAVVNNLFALSPVREAYNMRFGLTGRRFDNILFLHNTVWNGLSPLLIQDGCIATDVVVLNNIFGPKKTVVEVLTGFSIDFNLHNTADASGTYAAIGTNAVIGDPLFTDATTWNFSLKADSPAIGKGSNSSQIRYDINWKARSLSTPSMGAYE